MSKVYIVIWTGGFYSREQSNSAVFSTKEAAESYVETRDRPVDHEIEEWDVDAESEV